MDKQYYYRLFYKIFFFIFTLGFIIQVIDLTFSLDIEALGLTFMYLGVIGILFIIFLGDKFITYVSS